MINNKYKFIFTHIPKTAGSTILQSLARTGSSPDPRHEFMRNEIPAGMQEYFKFAFVRNPWERAVSVYFYRKKFVRHLPDGFRSPVDGFLDVRGYRHWPPVDEILNSEFHQSMINAGTEKRVNVAEAGSHGPRVNVEWLEPDCLHWLVDLDGNLLTDFIGRFENLQEDFNIVCDKIGIPRQELPHKNKTNHKHYTEYYNDETRQIVANKYAKDIEAFGYKFGD